jgi:succinoglycan biosynthesis transport protein ExoP
MMDQVEQNSLPNLKGWCLRLYRHRLTVAASLFMGWALLTTLVWFIPGKYRSETLILVEQQRVPEHYVEPNIALDLQQRLQSMSEQILSRTRLIAIIDKFHLYNVDRHADSDVAVERMRKDISIDLVKSDGTRNPIAAFKISYSANKPMVAQQVTSELTSLFIEENLRSRQQLSEDTTSFLTTQLDEARKNLDLQEQRLREFKSRYVGQLPEQTASNLQILTGLQTRLQQTTDGLHQAEQQRLYLQSLLNSYRAINPQIAGDNGNGTVLPPSYELDQKLEKLKSSLADLNAKYTPLHPDIVRLKQEIAATEKLKEEAEQEATTGKTSGRSGAAAAKAGNATVMSPAMQVESQLKANEFEIASRNSEIKKIEKEIDSYQQRLNLTPAREQELAAVTRDHDQSRANYDSLLAKKNQSEMATNLERRQQGEQFRMIDPPSLPQAAYFPNRLQFSLAGLALGLAMGIGLVVLREIVSPKVYGQEELQMVLSGPTVIAIPSLPTANEKRRNVRLRIVEALAAAAMLVVIPMVTFLVYRKG